MLVQGFCCLIKYSLPLLHSDLSPSEREKALKEVCRHRHQHVPPSTPEHYWELGLPNTAECKRRGKRLLTSSLPSARML